MFRTKHLVGRLRYETNQVVCFDVYLNQSVFSEDIFVTQALLSLVNGTRTHLVTEIDDFIYVDKSTISKEISEGIKSYIETRKELGLTPPYETE